VSRENCADRTTLLAYQAGELPEGAAHALSAHLAECAGCQELLGSMKDADALMARMRDALPDGPYVDEPQCQAMLERAMALGSSGSVHRSRSGSVRGGIVPDWLGEYQLLEKLGQGGMGAVYKALHTRLDKTVALKLLSAASAADEQAVARFAREMKAAGRLNHPHVVQAFDAGEIDGISFLAMEYVAGQNLSEIAHRLGWLPIADACEIARQTAVGLQAIHEFGLVHRDIKPSNLMLTREGQVKILDLGLARILFEPAPGTEATSAGQTVGTADYMAPEQINDSHSVDIRADIYSLGCTLYKLLSGHAPYGLLPNQSFLEKMTAHLRNPLPPLRPMRPEVPEALEAIVRKMLAKEPGDRFATPAELASALSPLAVGSNLPDLWRQCDATAVTPPGAVQRSAVTNQHCSSTPSGTNSSIELAPAPVREEPAAERLSAAVAGRSLGRWKTLGATLTGLLLLGLMILAVWAWRGIPSLRRGLSTTTSVGPRRDAGPQDHAPSLAPALAPELLNSVDMRLRLIPAGEFQMGLSPEEVQDRLGGVRQTPGQAWYIEKVRSQVPRHRIRITRPFYLAPNLVTQGEYQRVMGDNPSQFSAHGEQKELVAGLDTGRFPVDSVSWDEAVEFCRRLSQLPAERAAQRLGPVRHAGQSLAMVQRRLVERLLPALAGERSARPRRRRQPRVARRLL
jgi:serine/threonine protein kinase